MKFSTKEPYNNVYSKIVTGREEYFNFEPELTINLSYLKTNKLSDGKQTKTLICPFCADVIYAEQYVEYGSYEDRTDDRYVFKPVVNHSCSTIEKLEKCIEDAAKIDKETTTLWDKVNELRDYKKSIAAKIEKIKNDDMIVIVDKGKVFISAE